MNANIPTRWMDLDVIRSTIELRDDNTTSIEVICRWHENDIRLLPDPLANYDDPLGQVALLNMNVGTRIQARGLMTARALARGRGVRRRPVLGLALALTDLRPPRGRNSRGGEGGGSSSGGSGGGNKGGGGPSSNGSLVDEPKGSSDPILNRDEAIEIPPRSASSGHNRPFDPLQNVELTHYHFDGYGRQRPGSSLPPSPRSPGCLYTFQNPDSDVGERWLVLVTSGETESLGNIEVFKEEVKREAKNETFKVVLQRMTVSGSTPLGGMPAMPAKPTRKFMKMRFSAAAFIGAISMAIFAPSVMACERECQVNVSHAFADKYQLVSNQYFTLLNGNVQASLFFGLPVNTLTTAEQTAAIKTVSDSIVQAQEAWDKSIFQTVFDTIFKDEPKFKGDCNHPQRVKQPPKGVWWVMEDCHLMDYICGNPPSICHFMPMIKTRIVVKLTNQLQALVSGDDGTVYATYVGPALQTVLTNQPKLAPYVANLHGNLNQILEKVTKDLANFANESQWKSEWDLEIKKLLLTFP
ncbi:hypothetical protein BGZ59_005187 [Podila verticillata]|nr:hypothetical protein BGZ59_005187 [Podila verticillata]